MILSQSKTDEETIQVNINSNDSDEDHEEIEPLLKNKKGSQDELHAFEISSTTI
jgi:hypothetical protein